MSKQTPKVQWFKYNNKDVHNLIEKGRMNFLGAGGKSKQAWRKKGRTKGDFRVLRVSRS